MSIIYEALKKTEGKLADVQGKEDKKPKPKFKIYFIYVSVLCIGFLIANILFGIFSSISKSKAKKFPEPQPAAITSLAPPIVTSSQSDTGSVTTAQPEQVLPSFILNGIFFSENEGYALINNKIVKEGDIVDGATVAGISSKMVEIKYQDSVLTLSTGNR